MLDSTAHPAPMAFAALSHFLLSHAAPLLSAAAPLGDRPAVRRTARLLEDIAGAGPPTPRLRRELAGLIRLLSLRAVDEPDSLEAAMFGMIDPADPAVEEICLLTDRLREHLVALVGAEDAGDALERELAAAA